MKYNINVIKSVWRRLRKPSRATLDAICSQNAVYTEANRKTDAPTPKTPIPITGVFLAPIMRETLARWERSLGQPTAEAIVSGWNLDRTRG
jgi:glycerol kinase